MASSVFRHPTSGIKVGVGTSQAPNARKRSGQGRVPVKLGALCPRSGRGRLPPHPERDLLWFLATYAPLDAWQQDVLQIVRVESYYFYPQCLTKILSEGWASYWHAELFQQYDGVSPAETIEFARLHAGVVNPGGRFSVNPYYLGYTQDGGYREALGCAAHRWSFACHRPRETLRGAPDRR
jgi:hypothetical protein